MNSILLIGIAIFLGIAGGKICQRFKIPQVVGYIFIGLIVGKSIFHIFGDVEIQSLTLIVNFTLGIIGFIIGAELKKDVFKRYGLSIYSILLGEGILAFVFVAAIVTLLTGKLYLGLLLGAIASATDPASTINVLWEYKAKGPLTTTVTSIVALDDGLALIIYGIASVFAKAMITKSHFSLIHSIGIPVLEIVSCVLIGILIGLVVVKTVVHIKEKDLAMAFVLCVVAIAVGLSMVLHLDLILTSMALGATIINLLPDKSEKLIAKIKEMSASLYILFFVVVGAQLDISLILKSGMVAIALVYIIGRSFGKAIGAMLGGVIARARKKVTLYTGICLFTQGGVAMGLALSINHNLTMIGPEGRDVGLMIINIVVTTTFVAQVVGPMLVRFGIIKAGEAYKDITKEDLIDSFRVTDLMEHKFISIQEHASLADVIDILHEEESDYFPVVDKQNCLTGFISLYEIKHALLNADIKDMLLAGDIESSARWVVSRDQPVKEAFEIFEERYIECLPVVEDASSRKVVGVLNYAKAKELLDIQLLEKQADAENI